MTKIYDFPTFSIAKQLFYVPGSSISGGFTTGGALIMSPDPSGRGQLDIQPAMQTNEWAYPFSSWLVSKSNGQVLRVRLAPTPQIANGLLIRGPGLPWIASTTPPNPDSAWDSDQYWSEETSSVFHAALEGANTVEINLGDIGEVLQPGHVIGHSNYCYLIDSLGYGLDGGGNLICSVTVTPPFRVDINLGDTMLFRPYFMGTISNPDNVRVTYDATNNGLIQLGVITLTEAIVTADD